MKTTQDFLKYFKKIKNPKEFEIFLEQYKNAQVGKFAIIKLSGSTLENHIESIAEDIAFLYKLDLIPMIIHGAGKALDKEISQVKINNIRVTSSEDIYKVKEITNSLTNRLIEEITKFGGKAKNLSKTLLCNYLDYNTYGNVGKVIDVDYSIITTAIKDGFIPIFSNLGYINPSQPVNINADSVAKALFLIFQPMRLFFISDTGGVLDSNGRIIQHINIEDEIKAEDGMLFKINTIKEIISENSNSAAVIISAQNLIKEIFTIKGSGTFISNYKINKFTTKSEIDVPRLSVLLSDAFNKKLNQNYFDSDFDSFFIHNEYKAVGIIKKLEGYNYLCKFAVSPSHQGTGLAKYLWEKIIADKTSLVWRSKEENPANDFYNKRCNGFIKNNNWRIYWVGMEYLDINMVNTITNLAQSFN
jgi:acetylglutamate kinase